VRIDVLWVDVAPFLARKEQPVVLLERPVLNAASVARPARCGEFWVPDDTATPRWRLTKAGDHVRVPVTAYLTSYRAASSVLATGIEVGMRAVVDLGEHFSGKPESVTLVLGRECNAVDDRYRVYVGMAIRTG
jgi:hypothetical protein